MSAGDGSKKRAGPRIDWAKLTAPKFDLAKLAGPQVDWAKLALSRPDTSEDMMNGDSEYLGQQVPQADMEKAFGDPERNGEGSKSSDRSKKSVVNFPVDAERILSFLVTPERLEETIGDFAEGFHLMTQLHGVVHARHWYYWQVALVAAREALTAAWKGLRIWVGLGPA